MPLLNLPDQKTTLPGVQVGNAQPVVATTPQPVVTTMPSVQVHTQDQMNAEVSTVPVQATPVVQAAVQSTPQVIVPTPTVMNPVNSAEPNVGVQIEAQPDIADNLHANITQMQMNTPATEATQQASPGAADATQTNLGKPISNSSDIQTNEHDFTLHELLQEALDRGASDIHLSVGNRAILRIDGELVNMSTKVLTPEYMASIVDAFLLNRKEVNKDKIMQYDMGYDMNKNRFRVNIFKQQGNFTVVARLVPSRIKTVDELGLPSLLKDLGNIAGGLVLVTGPTGSGKSTTLAAVLNNINMTMTRHIITVEDPIEFIFPKGNCLINQREYGQDFDNWPGALKSILRQDPDIVLVGEMRDLETISSAITLSETGHLVFATLHTNSASQTMDRIIDVFPEGQQAQIRAQLANVIAAVIAQRLVPISGGGRTAVLEIMLANPAVRNTIREGKTHQIDNMISTGQDMGMVSMARALVELVNQGQISADVARTFAPNLEEFNSLLGSAG